MTELECALEEIKKLRILDAEKTARIAHLELLVDKLTFELAALKRVTFGQKTEASDALASDLFGDPTLGLETQVNPDAAVQPAPLKKVSSQAKAPPRITLPSDLPVEEVELDLAESEKFAADGTALKCIGVEISDKLAVTPSRFFIRRTKRFKYAHPGQEELGVKTAPLHQIIPGGIADASVYADVLIKLSSQPFPPKFQRQLHTYQHVTHAFYVLRLPICSHVNALHCGFTSDIVRACTSTSFPTATPAQPTC